MLTVGFSGLWYYVFFLLLCIFVFPQFAALRMWVFQWKVIVLFCFVLMSVLVSCDIKEVAMNSWGCVRAHSDLSTLKERKAGTACVCKELDVIANAPTRPEKSSPSWSSVRVTNSPTLTVPFGICPGSASSLPSLCFVQAFLCASLFIILSFEGGDDAYSNSVLFVFFSGLQHLAWCLSHRKAQYGLVKQIFKQVNLKIEVTMLFIILLPTWCPVCSEKPIRLMSSRITF